MKTIIINGILFENVNPNTKQGERIIYRILATLGKKYNNINEAYKRPSIHKSNIWTDWVTWWLSADILSGDIWICSRNNNYFSIAFKGFWGNHEIYGYITYSHNKVVII